MVDEVKKSPNAKLFAAVFGIACFLITGTIGYLFTLEPATALSKMSFVVLVFIMWMTYVGVFIDLNARK